MTVLDTHAWIWLTNGSSVFTNAGRREIRKSDTLGVSVISCWEVAMLVSKQRLGLSMDVEDWIQTALERPKVRLLPIDPAIAVLSTRLPGDFHGDPADRLIAATCLHHQSALITKDKRLRDWGQIRIIW
ncbi:type II toxin-antitoxin system VapC family toxin [bacterium]|nr:type II toxin-antitoxin system VapC family toxin [bacterium]